MSLARTALKAGGLDGALRNIPRLDYRFALDLPVLAGIGPADDIAASPLLVRAREAAATRDWAEAAARFAEVERAGRLGPADLDLWAYALACQGRFKAAGPVYTRAVEGYLAAAAPFRAASSAVSLGIVEVELGHRDAARAWIARAEDLLGPEGPPETPRLRAVAEVADRLDRGRPGGSDGARRRRHRARPPGPRGGSWPLGRGRPPDRHDDLLLDPLDLPHLRRLVAGGAVGPRGSISGASPPMPR